MAQSMNPSEVSKRYAKALFEVISDKKSEQALIELRKVQEALSNPKVKELAQSPVLSRAEKIMVADEISNKLSLSKDVESLLKLLASKDRLSSFDDLVKSFESISDEQNKVLRGVVKSPQKLSAEDRKDLEKVIAEFTEAQLILEYVESPELIGGVQAHVGSYTFDGSLDTQLRKLKDEVKAKVNN